MGQEMIDVSFEKIGGEVDAPPSKSFMQRYVLLSSFLDGSIRILNPGHSDDDLVSINIARSCGKQIYEKKSMTIIKGNFKKPEMINVGESGTSFRLVQGLLAASQSRTGILLKRSLAGRPMDPLINALQPHGYSYLKEKDSVMIDATHFKCPDSFEIDGNISSQFISSLMLCLALSRKENGVIHVRNGVASEGYIKITSKVLEDFQCRISTDKDIIVNSSYIAIPEQARIEGDYSSSAFLMVMGLLLSDEGITIRNLPIKTYQPDRQILEILGKYLKIKRHGNLLDVMAFRQDIQRITVDVNITPDLAPPLSVLGMFSEDGIEIRNPDRLRTKESDRLQAILDIARATGAEIQREEESIIISKGTSMNSTDIPERDDHRIVMAKFLAAAAINKNFHVHFHGSVNKSFPEFWKYASTLGFHLDFK